MKPTMKVTIRQEDNSGRNAKAHEVSFETVSFDGVNFDELYNLMKSFTIAIGFSPNHWDEYNRTLVEEEQWEERRLERQLEKLNEE